MGFMGSWVHGVMQWGKVRRLTVSIEDVEAVEHHCEGVGLW